jgi:glycosyltransferase involved in cell wall biosynthesis
MKLLIATDAWQPQVNGVVRTLQATIQELAGRGVDVRVVDPAGFRTFGLPTYPDIRLAVTTPRRMRAILAAEAPDAVHIATEGPIGWAMRSACVSLGRRFTTSYHTRFPEYVSARAPVPERLTYAMLRRFHAPAARVLVSTERMREELHSRGFRNLANWPRGVDTALFHPDQPSVLDLPRPILLTVSRLAPEKNLEAFLALDLPGSKVVVGDGPLREELQFRYPRAHFLGLKQGAELAAVYASADVFVFPSVTDTFGIVMLEAAASGLPTAAFPVPGPLDVLEGTGAAVLDNDLRKACLAALRIPRERCRSVALARSWGSATSAFLDHVLPTQIPTVAARPVQLAGHGASSDAGTWGAPPCTTSSSTIIPPAGPLATRWSIGR